jgi:DNA-binding LacI/PurR family transcriptional regulator
LGHTRIVHIAGPGGRNETFERERGYRDAMLGAGLEPVVFSGATDWSGGGGFEVGMALDQSLFTGVVASNDEIAMGFMCAAERRGLRAPRDYAITGMDDMPAALYTSPPLTTVRLRFRTVGLAALGALLQEISTGIRAEHAVIDPELVVRESTTADK